MSTRATFTFADTCDEVHVYQHYDGYPQGAAVSLTMARLSRLAWPHPRFEADEYAAAFIAANKIEPGGYRIVSRWDKAVDIEWHYLITQSPFGKQPLIIQVSKVVGDCLHTGRLLTKKHWSGPLSHFLINQGTIESREEVYA